MTNPNNGVGTNGAFGGRTSVNALNDVLACFTSRGILNGWACAPSEGMTIAVGGADGVRDVALAEDNAGNKTTVNNINATPVEVTLEAAPSTNSRIDAIVAYVDNPPQGEATVVDNPGAVGLIAVAGTTAASPSAPDEDAIRTAITADGASGTTAYYVVLATVAVASGTTDITADMITAGGFAGVGSDNVDWATLSFEPINFTRGESVSKIGENNSGVLRLGDKSIVIINMSVTLSAGQPAGTDLDLAGIPADVPVGTSGAPQLAVTPSNLSYRVQGWVRPTTRRIVGDMSASNSAAMTLRITGAYCTI